MLVKMVVGALRGAVIANLPLTMSATVDEGAKVVVNEAFNSTGVSVASVETEDTSLGIVVTSSSDVSTDGCTVVVVVVELAEILSVLSSDDEELGSVELNPGFRIPRYGSLPPLNR